MIRFDRALGAVLVGVLAVCVTPSTASAQEEASPDPRFEGFVPVTDAMHQDPDPDDWLMWRRTLDSWGYSPLDQIDRDNVDRIRQVWGRAMEPGINEATPLVYDGIMYLVNPGDVIQALDATSGDLLWEYRWDIVDDLADYNEWGLRQRNLTIYGDRIFHTTADGWLIALDARTGELEWETKTFDYRNYIDHTSAPIVVRGMLVSGEHCRPHSTLEGGCAVRAHDPETGEELWRRHVIARPGEPGGDTWGGLPLEERRHASTWLPGSYDPELDLIYWGTAVPAPSPEVLRGTGEGDLLYTNSTLALDPDDGSIVWYHQHLPRDNWDLDHPFERMLVTTEVAPDPDEVRWINPDVTPGEERRVVTGVFGKPGIVWSMDRETGEFLWARETIFQNVIADLDPRTGEVTINEDVIPRDIRNPVLACPSAQGGKNWAAGAYSPLTGAMYVPMDNVCSRVAPAFREARIEDGYAIRAEGVIHESAGGKAGTIAAVSASTGEMLWRHDQRASVNHNPLLTTGGGLVFSGDMSRAFRAFDQQTGEILWESRLHSPATGFPITYAVDGRQYLAVVVGGGMPGNSTLTPEIDVASGGNAVLVYALPESRR